MGIRIEEKHYMYVCGVIKRKLIALNTFINENERVKINKLNSKFKKLGNVKKERKKEKEANKQK